MVDNYGASPLVTKNIIRNSSVYGLWDLVVAAPTPGPNINANTFIDCGVSAIQTDTYAGPREGLKIEGNFILNDGLRERTSLHHRQHAEWSVNEIEHVRRKLLRAVSVAE